MSYGGTLKLFLRLIFDKRFFYFNVMKIVFGLLIGSFIVPFKNEKCILHNKNKLPDGERIAMQVTCSHICRPEGG